MVQRRRWISLWCAVAVFVLGSWHLAAQDGIRAPGQVRNRPGAVPENDPRPFNKRDLSGIWWGDTYGFNSRVEPSFTPEGRKRMDANKPSYGVRADSPEAKTRLDIPAGRRRSIPPALGNDPAGPCNGLGLTRLLLYDPSPMETIQLPDRIIQRFEWTWDHREIWMDGRRLPDPDEYVSRLNGYSVGRWEGDTLVVDTVGFDDRIWIDHFGYPQSAEARLQERWTRTGFGTLQLRMTLTDPLTYTRPWESDLVTFRYIPKENTAPTWSGLVEDKCNPMDEVDQFNERVRNPAGGVK